MPASPPDMPPVPSALPREELPPAVLEAVDPNEQVFFYTQPRRHSLGRGVWMVMFLGIAFSVASIGAVTDTWLGVAESDAPETWQHMGFGITMGLTGVFVLFSLMLLAWPLLSHRAMRATHVFVSSWRVVELKERRGKPTPKIRSWNISACPEAYVTRVRGDTASLVLSERVRERSTDGQTIYEWEAIHGIPNASQALNCIAVLRQQQRTGVQTTET